MTNKLFNEIKDYFHVNIKTNDAGQFEKDPEGYFTIEETGHVQEGGKIRHALKRHFKENFPNLYEKVEKHVEDTFYKATKRVPPVFVYMMAAGEISEETYAEKILEAPSNAEVVANYISDEKFVEVLYRSYEFWYQNKDSSIPLEIGSKLDFKLPEGDKLKMLDSLMSTLGLPGLAAIKESMDDMGKAASYAEKFKKDAEDISKQLKDKELEFAKKISTLTAELSSKSFTSFEAAPTGEIPSGKMVMKSVRSIFGVDADYEVPMWEWDSEHPDVPQIDEDYIFREELLTRALYAILTNQRMYLQGDTGSGKTTLIEQIAARLNWPFGRINFDSEITRMDLIGRDTLKDGKTEFIDGFLPKYMSGPYILCFDEIDFVRPDVAYVMQATLEGNGLVITEDGGRRVQPHPMMRMFGTGNTVGQGDEKGMYQGARPQSLAFLDRFTIWAKVPYLDKEQRHNLLSKRVPSLTEKEVTTIIKYSEEHLAAFESAKVLQPISPRGIIAIGRALAFLNSVNPKGKNLEKALHSTVLDRATIGDFATLKGIVDRVIR